jgi:hypothetical protein
VDALRNQTGLGAHALRLTNRYDVPITVLRASLVSGDVFEVYIYRPASNRGCALFVFPFDNHLRALHLSSMCTLAKSNLPFGHVPRCGFVSS